MAHVWTWGLIAAASATASPATPSAQADAHSWLAMIDRGAYAESWVKAGTLFKSRVTEAAWVQKIGPVRGPFGAVVFRRVIRETETASLPGAPDGRYDIVQFVTQFAQKAFAVETVVLAKEADGWKVDGYFIK